MTDAEDTEMTLYGLSGDVLLVMSGYLTNDRAIARCACYVSMLADVSYIRIRHELPWGDWINTRVSLGADGPVIEQELPLGAS